MVALNYKSHFVLPYITREYNKTPIDMRVTDRPQTHSAFEVVAAWSSKTHFIFVHASLDYQFHYYISFCWGSSVGVVSNWIIDESGFDPQQRQEIFLFSKASGSSLRPSQTGVNESLVFIKHRNAFTLPWLPFYCPKFRKQSRSWIKCLRTKRNNVAFGKAIHLICYTVTVHSSLACRKEAERIIVLA